MPTVLTLPGWLDSGPAHWQTRWEQDRADVVRVRQDDWEHPDCRDWVRRLDEELAFHGPEVILAAHSLGCLLVAHWAATRSREVGGALLVAVPDPDGQEFPRAATGFDPVPLRPLGVPAILVASRDDPYASMPFSRDVAHAWGARLVELGPCGHINGDSGLGGWDEGWDLIAEFG